MPANTTNDIALSLREHQVVLAIGQGATDAEIGQQLNIKYETVRSYVKRLRDKIGLRSKAQLAVWAAANQSWLLSRIEELSKR